MEYTAFFDGAAQKYRGIAGIGCLITKDEKIVWEYSENIGKATNNEAEYRALIRVVDELVKLKIEDVKIFGDSQLVVNQVAGNWRINHQHLQDLHDRVTGTLRYIPNWELNWIPREQNKLADNLSKIGMDDKKMPIVFEGEIEEIRKNIYVVYGTKQYIVDLNNEACTCPAFVNGKSRPCKHILSVKNTMDIILN